MKILLAGYNIDTEVIHSLQSEAGKRQDITPETLSAAYARISRSPKPVDELRRMAREEVEKARRSNRNIIFCMGHHSVAEHAIFNFDIIGVSRLAIEEIEKFRLNSYTEKSQRYITLEDDFVIPSEIAASPHKDSYVEIIREQNHLYHRLYESLKTFVFEKHAELAKNSKNHSMLDGWAKEDARYITALATEGQMGTTLNARNLELMFRRFASHRLAEIREIGIKMFQQVENIAPSIILFTEANEYDRETYPSLKSQAEQIFGVGQSGAEGFPTNDVDIVDYTHDADDRTAACLLHSSMNCSFDECMKKVVNLSLEQKRDLFKTACQSMELYDSALREFEYVDVTFDLVVSATNFAQLKRHRLVTLTCQQYDPGLGITVPDSIKEIGMEDEFRTVIERTERVYDTIRRDLPLLAPYLLTNAHRKRVLLKTSARELYHISRLRQDEAAQWDIRQLVGKMVDQAKAVMPLTLLLIGGKDAYPKIYEDVMGHPPKVTKTELPS